MHLVNFPENYQYGDNFWLLNPELKFIDPFAKLKDKEDKFMWGIVLYCESSRRTIFGLLEPDKKKEQIEKYIYPIPWDDELVKEVIKEYPKFLTPAKRAFKEYEDFLARRGEFLRNQDYTFENSEKLDRLAANSLKIFGEFKQIEEQFQEEDKITNIRGGRKASASEKKLL